MSSSSSSSAGGGMLKLKTASPALAAPPPDDSDGTGFTQQTVDLLAEVIASRVEAQALPRSSWRNVASSEGHDSASASRSSREPGHAALSPGGASTGEELDPAEALTFPAPPSSAAANRGPTSPQGSSPPSTLPPGAMSNGEGTTTAGGSTSSGSGAAAAAAAANAPRSGRPSRGQKGDSFGVSRLGIPGLADPDGGFNFASTGRSIGSALPRMQGDQASANDPEDKVRYLHIPKHAVKDFQTFARDVAAQACREMATSNPYVQALNKHRAELQSTLLVSEEVVPPANLTLEQRLSTQREALSTLSSVRRTTRSFAGCINDEDPRPRACGVIPSYFTAQCCNSRGDIGEIPFGEYGFGDTPEETLVYPMPVSVVNPRFMPSPRT